MTKLEELRTLIDDIKLKSIAVVEEAKEELRALTPQEEAEINDAKTEIKKLNEEVNKLNAVEEEKEELQEENEELERQLEETIEKLNEQEEEASEEDVEASEEEQDEEAKEEKSCKSDGEEKRNNNNQNSLILNKMEKRYSLVEEIRTAMQDGHKINLEARSAGSGYTVNIDGEATVQTNLYDILAPLREKSVLADAGAHIISDLSGNVRIPILGKQNALWEGETDPADDGSAAITYVDLAPKRVSTYVDLSLEFIQMDSVGAEAMIRQDIANAVAAKIEASIFSNFSGSTTQPKGMFAAIDSATSVSGFADICAAEASVEDANVVGNMVYVGSNKAKAALRVMPKSSKHTQLVMENGAVDGTPFYNTSFVDGYKAIYGDFSNLYIGFFGNTQIDVVRDSVSLKKGCVTLVVNTYVDFKVVRPTAFKAIDLE